MVSLVFGTYFLIHLMTLPETLVNREHPLGLLKQSARVIPMTAILEGETILIS